MLLQHQVDPNTRVARAWIYRCDVIEEFGDSSLFRRSHAVHAGRQHNGIDLSASRNNFEAYAEYGGEESIVKVHRQKAPLCLDQCLFRVKYEAADHSHFRFAGKRLRHLHNLFEPTHLRRPFCGAIPTKGAAHHRCGHRSARQFLVRAPLSTGAPCNLCRRWSEAYFVRAR